MLLGRTTWLFKKKHTSIGRFGDRFSPFYRRTVCMYDITTTSVCIRFPPKNTGPLPPCPRDLLSIKHTHAWQLNSKHAGSPEKYERKFLIELSRALRHNLGNVMIFLLLNRCRKVCQWHPNRRLSLSFGPSQP